MEKTVFSMEKTAPAKIVFATIFAGSWQNHSQKYFCNYKTSQKYCYRN